MLQLIIMALLEIILYTINEFIGRKILFAFDVGDTIFLHMFAAMFGLNKKLTNRDTFLTFTIFLPPRAVCEPGAAHAGQPG